MSESRFIPNSFQMPNILIDELMFLLTDTEWRVLCYMTRHILGWQDKIADRQRHMSLTMFVKGFLDYPGCGLNKPAVKAALDSLAGFGLIMRVGKPTASGQLWKLAFDTPSVDWQALRQRQEDKLTSGKKRIEKARATKGGKSDLPVSPTNRQRLVPLTASGKSDILNQTQVQTQVKTNTAPNGATPAVLINPMKDAIVTAFGWKWETMTRSEKGTVQTTAKQLCETKWDVEDVPALYAECKKRGWSNFSPAALLKVVSDVRKKQTNILQLEPVAVEEWGVDTFLRTGKDSA